MNLTFPLLLAAALGGAAQQRASEPGAMANDTVPSATVEENGLRLRADFKLDPATHALRVRYLLHNGGKQAVVLFDRGDSLAVAQGRLKAAAVAAPTTETVKDGLVVHHRAVPLRKPTPTVPPIPLVARVAPGGELGGDVLAEVGPAARVRYCLNVAAFEPALFSARQTADGVELWRASAEAIGKQKALCTPWFDVATLNFQPREVQGDARGRTR